MENVLYLGPDYSNHRGGIGAVLEVYARHIHPFKFIPTYVAGSRKRKIGLFLSAIGKLISTLTTDRKIRIVHLHHSSRGSFLRKSVLLLISKLFGKKVILHIHGGGFKEYYSLTTIKPYIRFILARADMIICLSAVWQGFYSSTFNIKSIAVVNNVIEAAPDSMPPVVENGQVNLLFLGMISERKGVFDLLDVITNRGKAFDQSITLTIAGNGETERLKKIIMDQHINGSITYAGWVNGTKKSELLHACDVYILPSYYEGLPVSILEAMAYGKPVIATNVGGIPEIVKPGYNGWLFNPGDQPALENILNEVIANKKLLKEFGGNSLEMSKNYTPYSVFSNLNILYNQLIDV